MVKSSICIITIISQLLMFNIKSSLVIENNQISINNFNGGETVTYEMILIRGTTKVNALNISVFVNGGDAVTWKVHPTKNTFKALAHLKPGTNVITITASDHEDKSFIVYYTPKTEGPAVRFTYLTSSDGDGSFTRKLPETDNSLESAKRRLTLTALIMQGSWAELMNDRGYGRQTFRIDYPNETGNIVYVKKLDKTTKELLEFNTYNAEKNSQYKPENLYSYVDSQINKNSVYIKNFAVLGMSDLRIESGRSITYCAAALGGGDLALSDANSFYTIPENLQEVSNILYNTSNGISPDNNQLWKAYGIGLVTGMDVLGSCFNLRFIDGNRVLSWDTNQIITDQSGIMSLGIYQGNRLLAISDGNGDDFSEDNSVSWNRGYTSDNKIQNDCNILSSEMWISDTTGYKIEAEANNNVLTGSASIVDQRSCSGCRKVSNINGGIQFRDIYIPESAYYNVKVYYHSDKTQNVIINAGTNYTNKDSSIIFPMSSNNDEFSCYEIKNIQFKSGSNSIKISCNNKMDFDKIELVKSLNNAEPEY